MSPERIDSPESYERALRDLGMFRAALDEHRRLPRPPDVHPALHEAQGEALTSVIEQWEEAVEEYEERIEQRGKRSPCYCGKCGLVKKTPPRCDWCEENTETLSEIPVVRTVVLTVLVCAILVIFLLALAAIFT